MRKHFLFTLFAGLLLSGAMMAEPLSPAVDYLYRLNWGDKDAQENPTYYLNIKQHANPEQGSPGYRAEFEIKWKSQYFALQQYNVPNIEYIKSMTLSIPHFDSSIENFKTNMSIWNFNANNIPTNSSAKSTLLLAVQATTGTALYADRTTAQEPDADHHAEPTATSWGSTTKQLATTAYNDHVWTATIGREVLTDISKDGTTGRVRFLITTKDPNAGTAAKYKAGSTLSVEYYAVYNETTHTGYDNLADAVSEANADEVLTVLADQTLSNRLNIENAITIDGKNHTITIANFDATGILVKAGATIKDCSITANNTGKAVFEFTGDATFSATINNVAVSNANVGDQGVYRIKNNATVELRDITNSNITTTAGYGEIFVAAAGVACNLRGTVSIASAYLEKNKRLNVNGATISTPIQLSFISTYADPYVCIQKSQELSNFTVYNSTKELFVSKTTDGGEISVRTIPAHAYDLTVTDAGMATLVLGYDCPIPAGVKAYKLTNEGEPDIYAKEQTSIKKNEPVLIVANADTYTFTSAVGVRLDEQADPVSGCLRGTYSESPVAVPNNDGAGTYNYILTKVDEEVGFFHANSDGTNTVTKNHAYLFTTYNAVPPASGAPARRMRLVFDSEEQATGIHDAVVSDKAEKLLIDGVLYIRKADHLYRIDGQIVK